MPLPAPDPKASPQRLFQQASQSYAVLQRIKAYIGLWRNDKRMKTAGEILLGEIERLEQEELQRAAGP